MSKDPYTPGRGKEISSANRAPSFALMEKGHILRVRWTYTVGQIITQQLRYIAWLRSVSYMVFTHFPVAIKPFFCYPLYVHVI